MVKFLDTFLNKLLDFLNFGRLITIIIPGAIVSFCLLMFASQILFPERMSAPQEGVTTSSAVGGNASERPAAKPGVTRKNIATTADKESLFQKQLSEDYGRANEHLYLIVFFTLALGFMLYELGYGILLDLSRMTDARETAEPKLSRYDDQHDADDKPTHKFNFSSGCPVGLVYFAPFLKEKFSGEENYFSFLITEYYRFLEFSVNMPVSIILSALLGLGYYILFSLRNACCPYFTEIVLFFIMLFVLPILFLLFVSPKVLISYKKASTDLVRGVSDLMAKGLK
jgi:hypothetical protein